MIQKLQTNQTFCKSTKNSILKCWLSIWFGPFSRHGFKLCLLMDASCNCLFVIRQSQANDGWADATLFTAAKPYLALSYKVTNRSQPTNQPTSQLLAKLDSCIKSNDWTLSTSLKLIMQISFFCLFVCLLAQHKEQAIFCCAIIIEFQF